MFLKNVILNRYRELLDQAEDGARRGLHQPRTYAKSRIVLNASALLRGGSGDGRGPRSSLRGDDGRRPAEQAQCFDKALKDPRVRGEDLEHMINWPGPPTHKQLWPGRDGESSLHPAGAAC